MNVKLLSELRIVYPKAVFGSLTIKNVVNKKKHKALEERKKELERIIRETFAEASIDYIIQSYNSHFKKMG